MNVSDIIKGGEYERSVKQWESKTDEEKQAILDENKRAQEEESKKRQEEALAEQERRRQEKRILKTGIKPLHRLCTFDNYVAANEAQQVALEKCKEYARELGFGGFVFSGSTGTGKNHLASAICMEFHKREKNVMMVTVNKMMRTFKDTMRDNAKYTENDLINELVELDLLVIDEIGLQRASEYTNQILNDVIDSRQVEMKPTGILTNLNYDDLKVNLGNRIVDRLSYDGMWISFNWESYRKNKPVGLNS